MVEEERRCIVSRRRRGRKAALRTDFILRWNETVADAETRPTKPNMRELDEMLRANYRSLPRDERHIAELSNVCMECGESGHWLAECPQTQCRCCKGVGHVWRKCPDLGK